MKFSVILALPALFGVLPLAGLAAENPYAGMEQRPIKALSEGEVGDYLAGRGMGTSRVAELNHYPGPRHVLDHAGQLGLSPAQIEQVQQVHDAMADEARRIGRRIVLKEAELEGLYASSQATAENTQRVVRELAALQADYRLAHLNAHLSMKLLLSPQQIAAYDRVRGYDGTNAAGHGHKRH
ncbi:MAG TPA: hypothetical protein VGE12_17595 [Noviherbaspirillum sp.]